MCPPVRFFYASDPLSSTPLEPKQSNNHGLKINDKAESYNSDIGTYNK